MRHIVGLIYVATALVGMYWSIYLASTGAYGVPFSPWYVVLFVGAIILLVGAALWWMSTSEWTRWVPIIGSLLLAMYFIPAFITLARQHNLDLIRVALVGLVTTSLVVAIAARYWPEFAPR